MMIETGLQNNLAGHRRIQFYIRVYKTSEISFLQGMVDLVFL